jgi:hypothetical protein
MGEATSGLAGRCAGSLSVLCRVLYCFVLLRDSPGFRGCIIAPKLSFVTFVPSPIMNLDNRLVENTEVSIARGRTAETAQIEASLRIDTVRRISVAFSCLRHAERSGPSSASHNINYPFAGSSFHAQATAVPAVLALQGFVG